MSASLTLPTLKRIIFAGLLLPSFLHPALAQPDTTPRNIVPIREPDPLTPAELQKLTGGPTLITFKGTDVPTPAILEAFQTAGNFALLPPKPAVKGETPRTVTVDWKQVPFWKAAQEVETGTGLRWTNRFANTLELLPSNLTSSGDLSGLKGGESPFVRILATSISRDTNVVQSLGSGAAPATPTNVGQLTIWAYYDPKLKVKSSVVRGLTFQTEAGLSKTDDRLAPNSESSGRGSRIAMPLRVALPSSVKPGSKISSVSGILRTNILTASQNWKVDNLAAQPVATRTEGITQYTVENVMLHDNGISFRVSTTGPRETLSTSANFAADLHLRDEQGRELMASSINTRTTPVGDGRFKKQNDLTFRATIPRTPNTPASYSLEWTLSKEIRAFEVPFEFRNIVVP